MNGYKSKNVIFNQTLNANKIHCMLQKRKDKQWGVMTPHEEKERGLRGLNKYNIVLLIILNP